MPKGTFTVPKTSKRDFLKPKRDGKKMWKIPEQRSTFFRKNFIIISIFFSEYKAIFFHLKETFSGTAGDVAKFLVDITV